MGGVAGAGSGVLGRSPLLSLLAPLDYPRQAAWNLARGPARLLQGEGSLDDILGMVPGLAGAGMAALGPLGLLGGALAGGAVQGLGKLTGSDAFEASTPQDVTGSEDFLPNLAVGAATDPLTFSGLGMGGQAGRMAGSRMAMHAAEPALAEGPEGILQAYRMGLPQGGLERDAAVSGLSGRNQALGQAVGDLAQAREARPGALAEQVLQQPQPGQFAGPPLPGALTPEDVRQFEQMSRGTSPEQAFEQMLPDYLKLARVQASGQNPRNYMPEALEQLSVQEAGALRQVPVSRLNEALAPPGADAGFEAYSREDLAQFRRHMAGQHANQQAALQLEQHGPLAAQLAKSDQLGPIESRLQMNWSMLHDMAEEGRLSPEQIMQYQRTAQLEDEAFLTLFEREPSFSSLSLPQDNFPGGWNYPPVGGSPPSPGSVGGLSGAPAFPSLEGALAQAQTQVGRPLQGWENQQLEAALAGRNPQPLQERGLMGDLGATPRDVNPPLPRGADLEVHTLAPQQYVDPREMDQAVLAIYSGPYQSNLTPNTLQGRQMVERQLGRQLTEAERAWLLDNYR